MAVALAAEYGFELHPPYSPDLASLDFYLFPKAQISLAGKLFDADDYVVDAVETLGGGGGDQHNYFLGITKMEYR